MANYTYKPKVSDAPPFNGEDGYGGINSVSGLRSWIPSGNHLNAGNLGNDSYHVGVRWSPENGAGTGVPQGATVINARWRIFVRRGTLVGTRAELELVAAADNQIDPPIYGIAGQDYPHEINPVDTPVAVNVPADPDPTGGTAATWFVDIDITDQIAPLVANGSWHTGDNVFRTAIIDQAASGTNHFIGFWAADFGDDYYPTIVIDAIEETGDPNIVVEDEDNNILTNDGTPVNLGTTPDGTAITEVFEVRNSGDANLTIASTTISGTDYSITVDISDSTVIAPGASEFITVQRGATAVGTEAGILTINSDDPDEPAFVVNLISVVQERILEVRDPTNTLIPDVPTTGNSPAYPFGDVEIGTSVTRQFKVSALHGTIELLTTTETPDLYNTVQNGWFTTAANANDQFGSNNLNANNGAPTNSATPDLESSSSQWYNVADGSQNPAGSLEMTNKSFIAEAWVTPESITTNHVVMGKFGSTAADREWYVRINSNGTLRFEHGDGTSTFSKTTTTAIATGGLHHIVCGRNASTGERFVFADGVNDGGTLTAAGSLPAGATNFAIGALAGGSSFYDGIIQGVLLRTGIAPTPAIAATLYNSGVVPDWRDPWSFTETIPDGTDIVEGTDDFFTIQFAPTAVGTFTRQIVITSDALATPFILNITGTGIAVDQPYLEVEDESNVDQANQSTYDLGDVEVGDSVSHEFETIARADDVEVATVRLSDPVGATSERYITMPFAKGRGGREAFKALYDTASSAIVQEYYSMASDMNQTTSNGRACARWMQWYTHQWNVTNLSARTPMTPLARYNGPQYGGGTSSDPDHTSNEESAELCLGVMLDSGNLTNTLETGRHYAEDNTWLIGRSTEPRNLYNDHWVRHRVASDLSMMSEGYEAYMIPTAAPGSVVGDGGDYFIDTTDGLIPILYLATFTSATQGVSALRWRAGWSSSPFRDATVTYFDGFGVVGAAHDGLIEHGSEVDIDRDSIGSGIHVVKYQFPFALDFRAEDSENAKYFWFEIQGAGTKGVDDPIEIVTCRFLTANVAAQIGRCTLIGARSGSEPNQMASEYAHGDSMFDALDPDIVFVGGFGNAALLNDTDANLQTYVGNYFDLLRSWKSTVLVAVENGWNFHPSSGFSPPSTVGPPLTTTQQSQLDRYMAMAYAADKDEMAVLNTRLVLETILGWRPTVVPTITLDGTHPGIIGGQRVALAREWCREILCAWDLAQTISDSTTLSEGVGGTLVEPRFTAPNVPDLRGEHTTTLEIVHDANDSPFLLNLTTELLASPTLRVEDPDQIVPAYELGMNYVSDFGTTPFGTPVDRVFTLENIGDRTLVIVFMSLNNSQFSFVTNLPLFYELEAGETVDVTIRLLATAAGSFEGASFRIIHLGDNEDGTEAPVEGANTFQVVMTGVVEEQPEDDDGGRRLWLIVWGHA